MKQILHIITRANDGLAAQVIERHQQLPEVESVEVIRLHEVTPDYPDLVERIFESDSVQVW